MNDCDDDRDSHDIKHRSHRSDENIKQIATSIDLSLSSASNGLWMSSWITPLLLAFIMFIIFGNKTNDLLFNVKRQSNKNLIRIKTTTNTRKSKTENLLHTTIFNDSYIEICKIINLKCFLPRRKSLTNYPLWIFLRSLSVMN